MKQRLFFIVFLFISVSSLGQKSLDTRVFTLVEDSSGIYNNIKYALVNEGFMIKDNGNKDTISTYPYNISSSSFLFVFAAIKGNSIEFWGYMGNANTNLMGITVSPSGNQYKKIFYYKHDKYWRKLVAIASRLNGKITYGRGKE